MKNKKNTITASTDRKSGNEDKEKKETNTKKQTTIDKKTKAILFKTIGSGLILFSFIIQNFTYDYWNTKIDEYYKINKDFSDMSRSSLLYLNLYYNAKIEDDTLNSKIKEQYINMAAQKSALGHTLDILTKNLDEKQKTKKINSIVQSAKEVNNFNSYTKYLKYSNEVNPYSEKDSLNEIKKLNDWRDATRWVFLILYIFGSFLLLFGIIYE